MGGVPSDIAEMPRLELYARDMLLVRRIAQYEPETVGIRGKPATLRRIGISDVGVSCPSYRMGIEKHI